MSTRSRPNRYAAPRSRAEHNDAAFKALSRRLLDDGLLGAREAAPDVLLTVSLDVVRGVAGRVAGCGCLRARWSREQIRRLLGRGTLARMALDAERLVVETSHTRRTATALERQISTSNGATRAPATAAPEGRPPATR